MTKNDLEMYKDFIDGVVNISQRNYQKAIKNKRVSFLDKLTPEELNNFFELLNQERIRGIHDLLVYLNDMQNLEELIFIKNEIEIPKEPFGTELHYDYVSRLNGDSWPDGLSQ